MKKHLFPLLFAFLYVALPVLSEAQDWRATAPYNCDFENNTENAAWVLLNGDSSVVNKWYIDTVAGSISGGTKSLYISDIEGSTYNYDPDAPASVIAYRDFTLSQGPHIISFDWNGVGERFYDYLLVALVPADDTTTLLGGVSLPMGVSSMSLPEGWINLGPDDNGIGLCMTPGWTHYRKGVEVPVSQNYRLVFIWTNDYSGGSNPPAAIDNISLRQVTCLKPVSLTAAQEVTSIVLGWTPGGQESQWLIVNGDTSYLSSSPSYTVTGLQPYTTYNFDVYSICSDGDTSFASSITATTGVTVPFYENFDSIDASFPLGWSYTLVGDSAYATPNYAPRLSNGLLVLDGFGYVVLPKVDSRVDTLQLTFSHSTPYSISAQASPLVVGVMHDNVFVPVDTIVDQPGGTYNKTVYFSAYQGSGRNIAFLNSSYDPDIHHCTHYIDNLRIDFLPSCFPVAESHATADSSSVIVSWTPVVSQGDWIVTLSDNDDTMSQTLTTTTLSAQFTGLSGNHTYTYSIRALCDVDDTSAATHGTVRTLCSSIPHAELPYSYGFEDEEGAGLCWHGYSDSEVYAPYAAYGSTHSGDRSYVLSSSANNYSYVVLPLFQDNPNSLMVSLWMCAASADGTARLVVGVMDDPADLASFTAVDTISCTGREMAFFEVPLTNYQGVGRNIAILCESGSSSRAFVDDVTVETTPTCSRVRNVSVPVVSAGAALVNWSTGLIGDYQGAAVQIRETSSDSWVGFYSDSTSYLLTNLFHNFAYEIRVAAICQNGDTSRWVNSFITTAMTGCNSIDSSSLTTDTVSGLSNSNHYEFPVHNWHNYSFSEQLFTSVEIDTAGSFSAIEFFYAADSLPMSVKDSCLIYMGVTSLSSIDRINFVNPIDMTLVYSGPLNCSYGWNTFAFNRGFFNYDGRGNLVVAIVDNSGAAHDEQYRFACHSATGKSVSFFSDDYTFDNYLLMDVDEFPYRNNIVFHTSDCGIESDCYPPMVFVDSIGADQVDFTIIPGGYEVSWDVYQCVLGDTAFSFIGSTTQSHNTLSGLEPSTTYTIRVVGDCEDTPTSTFTITTRCLPRQVPFTDDFSSWPVGLSPIVPSCWYKFSTLGVNTPYIYTWSVGNRESVLSLFSNSGNYSYVALPELSPAIDSLQLSFFLYREGNNAGQLQSDHRVVVGVMSDVYDIASFHPLYTITAQNDNTWQLFELHLDTLAADTSLSDAQFNALRHGRIALLSPDSVYSHPYLDEITVDYIPRCFRPTDIHIDNSLSTADSVCFSWNGTSSRYMVTVDGNDIYTSDNHCFVAGLNSSMVYTVSVRGLCDEYSSGGVLLRTDTSAATSVQLRTPCGKITNSLWFESFELNPAAYYFDHSFARCWMRINDSVTYFGVPYVSDDRVYNRDCHTGDRGLAWIASPDPLYGDNQFIVTPEIDTASLPINYLQVSFWAHARSASHTPVFMVGLMDHGDSLGTSFVPVDTIVIGGVTSWRQYTVYLNGYQGDATHIAIKASRSQSEWEASIDDIEIKLMPLCPPVSDIVATAIDTNSLDVSWTDHSTAAAWEVEYGLHGFVQGTGTQLYTSTTSVLLSNLATSTLYDIYVRPICGDDALFASASISTADPYFGIPFACNFSNPDDNAKWSFVNGQHVNAWTIGGALGNGDNSSLYVSCDGGATNTYNRDVSGVSYAYVNLNLPDTGNYNYRFDWRSNGQSQFDYLRVALVPVSFLPGSGASAPSGFGHSSLPLGWIALDGGSQLYGDTTGWTTVESEVHIVTPGIYRMLFVWIDDQISFGHQSPAAIDNVVFRHTSCQTPSNLTILPYDDSVLVSWVPNGDESMWIVTCGGVSQLVQNTSLTITGLVANSPYQVSVRAFCIEGDTSMAVVRSFNTTCHPVSLPYSENFDALTTSTTAFTGVFPSCWSETVINTQGNRYAQLYYGSSNAHSGNYSLFLGKEAYVALPPMPEPLSDLEITFHHLVNNSDFGFEIGVLEGDSFIPLASYSDPEESYVEHTLSLRTYNGPSRIIAFHNTNPISIGSPNFVDDILVDYIPQCLPVVNINAPVVSTDAINIDWTDASQALSWQIEYGASGFAPGTGNTLTAFAHPVAIAGLDTMTTYDFYVRSYCGDSSYSDWTGPVQLSTVYCSDATSFSIPYSQLTSPYLPLSTSYNYSTTEFIVDSDELGAIGDISAIAFYYSDTAALTVKDSVTIWLQPTSVSSFANDNSFIPLNPGTAVQVYSGNLECHRGWNFFNLTENYVWDGVNNLLVIIDDNSGSGSTDDLLFNVSQCSGYKSISYRSMLDNVDPAAPNLFYGLKSRHNFRPVMQLISCGSATCHTPVDLAVTSVTWDSATVTWRGVSQNFEVAIRQSGQTAWSDPISVSTSSTTGFYTFSGLDEMTDYDFRVRQLCVSGLLSDWTEYAFTTAPRPCMAPQAPSLIDVSYNQATVSWTTPNPNAVSHLLLGNGTTDIVIVANESPFTLTGLSQNFTYTVAVADSCTNNGTISDYSPVVSFTTLLCEPVSEVSVSEITATSAVVSWTGGSGEYSVEYGTANFSTGTGTTIDGVGTTTLVLNNLTPDEDYDVYVRSFCGASSYSLWSNRVTFHTSSVGISQPSTQSPQLTLSPNPADESVSILISGFDGDGVLSIIDIAGRPIIRQSISGCSNGCAISVNVDHLPTGSYFVRVSADNCNIVRKFVVKH